ncbi:3-hydroxybutyryl-CoA dehydrogenase [Thermincola potens]|uniref:L-gulonate 3-dehydrogenase n=1 Tax=Thermincola potens (strain JR) TaxID=635013 RepID=D5XAP6_THEPJ|nr:3-hydroxybutyryl-CoA dehydrogenase [Thermincola potens]ADG83250.1 3-hydroxyacyl-CoA dehydrogenase NAD-binding protein [Thermincola potens JR]
MDDSKTIITVVGAGRMGTGIAQVFASAGHNVRLLDLKKRSPGESRQVLLKAREQIEATLSLLTSLGVTDEVTAQVIAARVTYHGRSQAKESLEEAGVVFEAVPEILEAKEEVFAEICRLVSGETIIASTTSTFLADTLASFIKGAERFMNTHWLNPAYLIPLVEVSPAHGTSPAMLEKMIKLLESIGKVPVKCAPSPGFIVPRIQALAMNEAARLVDEGVAEPEDIDKACRVGFGLRFAVLGLLEFIDWGGGDTLYYAGNYLAKALNSERFAPPTIITENMEKGKIGLKTGHGFYNYRDRDVSEYQRETLRKFVDLLKHLGLLAPPHGGRD